MDQTNQTHQQTHPYININNSNPLQFTIHLPNSSNPNPNPNSDPNSIQTPNPNLHLIPSQFLSLSIPRRRRRGRPRNATPSLSQVFNVPSSSNATTYGTNINFNSNGNVQSSLGNPNFSNYVKTPNFGSSSSSISSKAVSDVNDEIIVINKEATAEALIALTAGFPADSLTDEEIEAGVVSAVGGIEQVNYILIRNHIIAKWRENVTQWITKEMFVDIIPNHCSKLFDSAYNYLVSRGYINFGVAQAVKERISGEPSKLSVIVIGAGLAGLAAARQLMSFGFKVTVLEGRKRAGGRVYTKKMEGAHKSAAADLGGSVLTGTLGNPLGILARQLSYMLHKIRDKCPLYRPDGKPVDLNLDQKVEAAFNRLLDKASKLRQLMGEVSQDVSLGAALETFWEVYGDAVNEEEMNLFNWHLANLEYANAGLLSKLSLAFWDQDDPYDMGGDHCFLTGGNGKLVQALAENVPILYEKTVHTISYGGDGVQVIAGSQVFEGDMALCTVPLGVLKSASIKFVPELPQRKLDGIKRLGFGLLNKVAMLFPRVFWGTDLDTFGHLCNDPSHRGEFFLFYSYATVAGGPLLIALVAGEAAHKFETMPPTDAVTHVLQILKGIYEPQGIEVPEPIQTVCTRWGSDPFSLGAYSNVAVGASGDDYDILAESVGDGRVFFAGEATNRRYPATMHGAFLSGLREAANIVHSAAFRSSKLKVEKYQPKSAHSFASILADLFRDPDLEFGSFAVIFARDNCDPKSTAILRVTFSGPRKKSHDGLKQDQHHTNKLLFQQLQSHFNQQQELHVYTLLSRQQVLQLREVRGGDELRLNYLCEKLGVKLVGRKGLGPSAESIIASIKAERANRKPASSSLALKSGTSKSKAATLKQKLVRKAKILGKTTGLTNQNSTYGINVSPLSNVNALSKSVSRNIESAAPNLDIIPEVLNNDGISAPRPNSNVGVQLVGNVTASSAQSLMSGKLYGVSVNEGSGNTCTLLPNVDPLSKSVCNASSTPSYQQNGGSLVSDDSGLAPMQTSNVGVQFVGNVFGSSMHGLMVGENSFGSVSEVSGITRTSQPNVNAVSELVGTSSGSSVSSNLDIGVRVVSDVSNFVSFQNSNVGVQLMGNVINSSAPSLMLGDNIVGNVEGTGITSTTLQHGNAMSELLGSSCSSSVPLNPDVGASIISDDSGFVPLSNTNVDDQLVGNFIDSSAPSLMLGENFFGGVSDPSLSDAFENSLFGFSPHLRSTLGDDNI